jgi:hypothetical protein
MELECGKTSLGEGLPAARVRGGGGAAASWRCEIVSGDSATA